MIKGAAWSLPVIAVAAAVPAMAASTDTDLVPSFGGSTELRFNNDVGSAMAIITTANALHILNNGPLATPTTGTQVLLQYDPTLLTLNMSLPTGVVAEGSQGDYTLLMPSIPAGGSLDVTLGPILNAELTYARILQLAPPNAAPQMVATAGGDTINNNNASSTQITIALQ
nr:hypothetical protein [Microbacterium sp. MAH-37]